MSRTTRFKIGLVAALWVVIGFAAAAGWMIGHGSAALQISDLKQRIATGTAPKQTCGMEIELLEARAGNPFGVTLGGILPRAPKHPHLPALLTGR